MKSQEQQEGDSLSALISSISQPVLIYLTTQAHRREIKSREMLIALANVKGQEVTDNTRTYPLHILLVVVYSCNNAVHWDRAYGFKSSFRSFFLHKSQCVTHESCIQNDQLVTSYSTYSLYRKMWSRSVGQLAKRMSSA